MSAALDRRKNFISFEEYVLGEEMADERHEYINGQVVEMTGASDNHELVAMNIAGTIHAYLRGRGCRVYKGDMKLRFKAGSVDLGYYPDVMVVCDPEDSNSHYKKSPKLLVEVMSRFNPDHFEKLFIYKRLPSLEEYLVLDQDPDEPRAWLSSRQTGWEMPEPVTDGELELASIGLKLSLADLYRA